MYIRKKNYVHKEKKLCIQGKKTTELPYVVV